MLYDITQLPYFSESRPTWSKTTLYIRENIVDLQEIRQSLVYETVVQLVSGAQQCNKSVVQWVVKITFFEYGINIGFVPCFEGFLLLHTCIYKV